MRRLTVTADDYGRTRSVTDTILQCIDAGALDQVSMFVVEDAFNHAVEEFSKRENKPAIALHLNLTEGHALSPKAEIPHLVDEHGIFRYSSSSLWVRYIFALPRTRHQLRWEIALELSAQWNKLRRALLHRGVALERLDGHQHIHIVPFVLDEIIKLPGLRHVRLPSEPMYFVSQQPFSFFRPKTLAGIVLGILSHGGRRRAKANNITTNDHILGFFFSGRMTLESIETGLRHIQTLPDSSTEIILHPGSAKESEFIGWEGKREQAEWQFSPWRTKERELLLDTKFHAIINEFKKGTLPAPRIDIGRIVRFIISGGLAAMINLVTLYLFTEFFGIWYLYSTILAFSVSVIASFILQKFWTFSQQNTQNLSHQFVLYVGLQLSNLVLDTLGVYILVEYIHVWYILAQIISLAAIAVWTYFIFRRFLFKETSAVK